MLLLEITLDHRRWLQWWRWRRRRRRRRVTTSEIGVDRHVSFVASGLWVRWTAMNAARLLLVGQQLQLPQLGFHRHQLDIQSRHCLLQSFHFFR